MTANDIVSRLERPRWTSPIILRGGTDPDAVARLVRQGVIPDPALPAPPQKPRRAGQPRRPRSSRNPAKSPGPGWVQPTWDVDRALILAQSGFTSAELASIFDVHADTIRYQLGRRGFAFSKGPVTDHEIETIRALVSGGMSRRDAARHVGRSHTVVLQATDDLPRLTSPNRIDDETAAAIRARCAQGLTHLQVSREFDVSESTVSRCVNRKPVQPTTYEILRAAGVTTAEVRAWCREQGMAVKDQGYLSRDVARAYLAARDAS